MKTSSYCRYGGKRVLITARRGAPGIWEAEASIALRRPAAGNSVLTLLEDNPKAVFGSTFRRRAPSKHAGVCRGVPRARATGTLNEHYLSATRRQLETDLRYEARRKTAAEK